MMSSRSGVELQSEPNVMPHSGSLSLSGNFGASKMRGVRLSDSLYSNEVARSPRRNKRKRSLQLNAKLRRDRGEVALGRDSKLGSWSLSEV